MTALKEAARDFLSSRRIAVAGVSRDGRQTANSIYRRLRSGPAQIFAVNPRAEVVEGDPCYPNLTSIPGGVEAVLMVTPPEATLALVRECGELGIRQVWMHRSFGEGSVSPEAVAFCRRNGIRVIAGACPMMFHEPVDIAHRCLRTILGWFHGLPEVE